MKYKTWKSNTKVYIIPTIVYYIHIHSIGIKWLKYEYQFSWTNFN